MTPDSVRVAIVGARGKMGVFTQELVRADPRMALVGEITRNEPLEQRLRECAPDVAVDFTVAGQGAANGHTMLACGVRPLIGTSGVDDAANDALDTDARERGLGGLVVPNFCLGIWLEQRLALEAARYFRSVEIIEEHHATKVDAPSGTAADTASQLARAGGVELGDIPIHSVRIPGLHSNQTVVFGGPGEVLRITHESYGLAAFGPGILAGIGYAAEADGVARGVGHAFEALNQSSCHQPP